MRQFRLEHACLLQTATPKDGRGFLLSPPDVYGFAWTHEVPASSRGKGGRISILGRAFEVNGCVFSNFKVQRQSPRALCTLCLAASGEFATFSYAC